ncbi:MAG: hypothetical protein D4R65_12275 [Verrucomicrobiaceae bacterium]|nr:MAG: hypothetical protein D4R65_12275 [Verrucomicrobiaceae bacterium]
MRSLTMLLLVALTGCAPTCFVAFSDGYDPATSLKHSLPAMTMAPAETRKAFLPAPDMPFVKKSRIASEDPRIVLVWEPMDKADIVRIQAIAEGSTLMHRGNFPFQNWNPRANPVDRAAWRGSLRRFLKPRPDAVSFRSISDADLWKTVLRSRSDGALRIVVEEDRLKFD